MWERSSYLTWTAKHFRSRTKLFFLKLLTLGPRDPRIGDRPSPWGRGGRGEGFRGLHSPQINQPSASRPEVQPQKAITTPGTLNLDRLHSFSRRQWEQRHRLLLSHYYYRNMIFFMNRMYAQRKTDHAKLQWKTLTWMKATKELLTVRFRSESEVRMNYSVRKC